MVVCVSSVKCVAGDDKTHCTVSKRPRKKMEEMYFHCGGNWSERETEWKKIVLSDGDLGTALLVARIAHAVFQLCWWRCSGNRMPNELATRRLLYNTWAVEERKEKPKLKMQPEKKANGVENGGMWRRGAEVYIEEIDAEQNVERYPFVVNAWNGLHKKAIIFIYSALRSLRRSFVRSFVPSFIITIMPPAASWIEIPLVRCSLSNLFSYSVLANLWRGAFRLSLALSAIIIIILWTRVCELSCVYSRSCVCVRDVDVQRDVKNVFNIWTDLILAKELPARSAAAARPRFAIRFEPCNFHSFSLIFTHEQYQSNSEWRRINCVRLYKIYINSVMGILTLFNFRSQPLNQIINYDIFIAHRRSVLIDEKNK